MPIPVSEISYPTAPALAPAPRTANEATILESRADQGDSIAEIAARLAAKSLKTSASQLCTCLLASACFYTPSGAPGTLGSSGAVESTSSSITSLTELSPTTSGDTGGTSDPAASSTDTSSTSTEHSDTTEGVSQSVTGVSDTSTDDSTVTTESSETAGVECPGGTVTCLGDSSLVCDGAGGFTDEEICDHGCVEGSGCRTCTQVMIPPACSAGYPRVMVLLDSSSSTLNISDGSSRAPPGVGSWDQIRDALAGETSIFDIPVDGGELENRALFGLSTFGHNAPEEQKIVVPYGSCHKANVGWALDPATSCEAPGCTDPYSKPPVKWTFKDGQLEDPNFKDKTVSHMPRCDFSAQLPNTCIGSGTYAHLGLNLLQSYINEHRQECSMNGAYYPCTEDTQFINIVIMDGIYNSTDTQVQMPLQAMYNLGVTTYIIGYGPLLDTPQAATVLEKMASWGSGNIFDYYDANNQEQLEAALAEILSVLVFC